MDSDTTPKQRRRIVMLVDNGVNGDSRVQKEARSAAEAGWDVTLLGRSPDGKEHTWSLGPAQVRLLPTPFPLSKRPHEFRRHWLAAPLAYPLTGLAEHRTQKVRAWKAGLQMDRLMHSAGPRRLAVEAQWQASRVIGRWDGDPVDLELSRSDGCRIAQWDSLGPLLAIPVGGQPVD